MSSLNSLKKALREAADPDLFERTPLSDEQYSTAFKTLLRGSERTYRDFIIPQLSHLLISFANVRDRISVLEIGPGPTSVLESLPSHLGAKIARYVAFEPNRLFATRLEQRLCSKSGTERFCNFVHPPMIHREAFMVHDDARDGPDSCKEHGDGEFDIVLFCHSMYGMKPRTRYIQKALGMLVERSKDKVDSMVIVFHREETLDVEGVVCHRSAIFPAGNVCVPNDEDVLDAFCSLIAGFCLEKSDAVTCLQAKWRSICRSLCHNEQAAPSELSFSSPNIMMAFTRHAMAMASLSAQVPLSRETSAVKNYEAGLRHPASIVRPQNVHHVQRCVQWAIEHGLGLSIVGGGHSGHCLWPSVVAVDMSAFNQVHVLPAGNHEQEYTSALGPLVFAEAGCKTGDIVQKAMTAGLTVPLGARPSVGAGLWLQGGLGHLTRLFGLACDSIMGALIVSARNGELLYIGHVPSQYRPVGATCPTDEADLLWAIKGAGTNFGIVMGVTFKAYVAPIFSTRHWISPLDDDQDARLRLVHFDTQVAAKLARSCSSDAYLYWDAGQLQLGITTFETLIPGVEVKSMMLPESVSATLGPENHRETVDNVGLFDAEMYVSKMHGGHGKGKTFSFKRCLFLRKIADVTGILVRGMNNRPTALCYLHLLQGGGSVRDIAAEATAFGCRDWDFACVVTGVWFRKEDQSDIARAVVEWVYNIVQELLPWSDGVYSADLGPDPRDYALAAKAFGPNRPQLINLKRHFDPYNVLAYACPFKNTPIEQKLIILVTGESGSGKDYCASVWASVFKSFSSHSLTVRTVSISDATKRQYAEATGADLERLIHDRDYKEQHRPMMTVFFHKKVQHRPLLPQEHFLEAVSTATDADVLLITGMRDKAPVSLFSSLVPDARVVEVRILASGETRRVRRGLPCDSHLLCEDDESHSDSTPETPLLDHCPSFTFTNDISGDIGARNFGEERLLLFFDPDLQCLRNMIRPVYGFPRQDIAYRYVLGICQQSRGLDLCTSLLHTHFTRDWADVAAIVCCEASGFIFASPLSMRADIPLVLIRQAGKLPPPTVSVPKPRSHISSSSSDHVGTDMIEMEKFLVHKDSSVVIVDDVLATGKTLCATLQLLEAADIRRDNISIMVVAEFPVHRGRHFLLQCGYGGVHIQSLLTFDGA